VKRPRRGACQALDALRSPFRFVEPLGAFGEGRAELEYARQGAEILGRNFRCREGELDLVVLDGGILVAVEVKTRSVQPSGCLTAGAPGEAVNRQRLARLGAALLRYQTSRGLGEFPLRIDVVEIVVGPSRELRTLTILRNVTG
jgi:putative endonuclease